MKTEEHETVNRLRYIVIASEKPKVYISGQMSGIEDLNFPRFNHYAKVFRRMGMTVLNPAERNHTDKSWFWYIIDDLKWIEEEQPEYFFMLRGWQNSCGAVIEHAVAVKIGATIVYE